MILMINNDNSNEMNNDNGNNDVIYINEMWMIMKW